MHHQKHDDPAVLDQAPWYHSNLMTQLRLFGLLALMIPLFSGLQYIVREGVPRVEVRLVTQDVPTTIAVEVPVERVVERVVYVPVERTSMATTGAMEPARDIDLAPVKDELATVGEVPVEVPAAEPEVVAEAPVPATPVAEVPTETPAVLGVIAYAPPAPVVRAAPVAPRPAVVVAAPVAYEPEEIADDAEAEAETVVAEAEGDEPDADVVAEAATNDQDNRVAMLSPGRQLGPGSNDSPLNGLGNELYQSEPKRQAAAPAPDPEPAVEAEIPGEPAAEVETPDAEAGDEAAEPEPAEERAVAEAEASHDESGAPFQSEKINVEAVKESDEDEPAETAAEDAAPEDDSVSEAAPGEISQEEGQARQVEHTVPELISIQ